MHNVDVTSVVMHNNFMRISLGIAGWRSILWNEEHGIDIINRIVLMNVFISM